MIQASLRLLALLAFQKFHWFSEPFPECSMCSSRGWANVREATSPSGAATSGGLILESQVQIGNRIPIETRLRLCLTRLCDPINTVAELCSAPAVDAFVVSWFGFVLLFCGLVWEQNHLFISLFLWGKCVQYSKQTHK